MDDLRYFKWKGSFEETFGTDENGNINFPDWFPKKFIDKTSKRKLSILSIGALVYVDKINDKIKKLANINDYVVYIISADSFTDISKEMLYSFLSIYNDPRKFSIN